MKAENFEQLVTQLLMVMHMTGADIKSKTDISTAVTDLNRVRGMLPFRTVEGLAPGNSLHELTMEVLLVICNSGREMTVEEALIHRNSVRSKILKATAPQVLR